MNNTEKSREDTQHSTYVDDSESQPANHSQATPPRSTQFDPHLSARLTSQLKEALRCLEWDEAEGLNASISKVCRLTFDIMTGVLEARRKRQASLLGELRQLRAEHVGRGGRG